MNLKRKKIIIATLLFTCYFFNSVFATEVVTKATTVIKYDIYADDDKIGESVNSRKSGTKNSIRTLTSETDTLIKISFFFSDIKIESQDRSIYHDGDLFSYRVKFKKGKDISKIKIVKNSDEYTGKWVSEGEITNAKFKSDLFDFTSVQLPPIKKLQTNRTLKMFNIENGKILSVKILKIVENQTVNIDNQTFNCTILSIKKDKHSIKQWISKDHIGQFLLKEEGEDENGPYKLLMNSYEKF
ncbi:MAG: hypothetical protein GY714_04020 [Desulfobacterales bacterium]|nr:hypothetical protein [Desulfobacterales bacterium]MCP4162035.1 hypothetical protein [Deltaproteobacteria bacterium]